MATSTAGVTTDTTNYTRIHLILMKGGTLLTKTLFLKRVKDLSPAGHELTVDEFLGKHRVQILSTSTGRNNEEKLYPTTGTPTNLDEWDLPLYCFILKTVCDLPVINKLDMGFLKTMRNDLSHLHDPSLNDADFKNHLSIIEPIFSRSLQIINDPLFEAEIKTLLLRCETGALAVDEVVKVHHDSSRKHIELLSNQVKIMKNQVDMIQNQVAMLQNQTTHTVQMHSALSMLMEIKDRLPSEPDIPDVHVIIEVKNCTKEKEKELLDFLVKQFNETVSKPECTLNKDFPNLAMHTISEAICKTFQSFLEKGRHIIKVENKCISLTIKCNSISSFVCLVRDCMDGKLLDQLKILIDAVKSWEGCTDVNCEPTLSPDEITGAIVKLAQNINEKVPRKDQDAVSLLPKEFSTTTFDVSTSIEDPLPSCSTSQILRLTIKPETVDQRTEIEECFSSGSVSNRLEQLQSELKKDPGFTNVEIKAKLLPSEIQRTAVDNSQESVAFITQKHLNSELSTHVDESTTSRQCERTQSTYDERCDSDPPANDGSLLLYRKENKVQSNTKEILTDRFDLLRKCKPYYKLKAVVLGKKEKGKTTLVDILANRKYRKYNVPPERKSIVRTEVVLRKEFSFFNMKLSRDHDITLNVWDLAGDEVYTQIHHSLFTPRTLYILVWDFWSIKDEMDKIKKLINNIQASTTSYTVVLVGTFIDKTQLKPEMIQETKDLITEQLGECAPKLCPVSCISMEGIEYLKTCMYETACSIILPTRGRETVFGRKIPKTYKVMEKLLMQTQCDLEYEGKPLFLTQSQFVEIIERIPPPNDLLSAEEITNVTKFLVEVGHLLHFSDPLGALDTLYFLDPAWLYDILLHVLISPEGKKLLKQGHGRIHREDAKKLYEECTRFPSMFIDQYLELLERFEIATSISQSEFLFFPCQLPIYPPIIDTAEDKLDEGICLRRLYRMAECPSGFWMLLVSRMMMRVDQFAKRDWHFRPMTTHSVRAFNLRRGSYHGLQIKTAKKTFCRELIHVSHEDGSFCVEPAIFSGLEKKSSLQNGVLITEVSKTGNFGIMGIIVDEIEDIIQDFYPGLLEPDMLLLSNRLERYALCSACYQGLPLPTHVYHFKMEHCARLLISGENIICPRGIKQDVNMLVPDLLLKELPEKYFLDVNKLELAESMNSCLGVGVTGSVFKAKYNGRPVAVKVYRSDIQNVPAGNFGSNHSISSDSGTATLSTEGSVVEEDVYVNIADTKVLDMNETESIKALKALKEMRQEVGITSRLHHPCVISFIGLAFRPKLMMALEFAPLGSLRDLLDKKTQGRPVFNRYRDKDALFKPLFEKELIFKFVYQIAKGLEYLHSNGIIYKDLKSDNILAMSDELSAPVNLKLSDYGISKYCWSGRPVGLVGTPGYQAPEILNGKAYDEKVDIFAFAMVIYEILTGRRPYSEYETLAQITKAIKTEGKRPNTRDYNVVSKFPCIDVVMRECWENNVFSRPSATEMVSKHKMQNLQFLAQSWAVDLRNQKLGVNCVLGPAVTGTENKELLFIWDVRESGRSFYILDPEWKIIPVLAQKYEGAQVQCMAKVGKHIWVGNADKTVQVFTHSDAGTLDEVGCFQLEGVPVQILAVQHKTARVTLDSYSVYIAIDHGHMLLFKTIHSGSRVPAIAKKHTVKNISGYTDSTYVVLRSRATYCMAYAESKHEIWVSSNKYINIVSCAHFKVNSDERVNLKILLPICGISPSFIVSQMVCVGSQMFCMLAFSPFILDFDTNSYHCQSVLNLESPKLLGLIVTKDITFTEADHEAYCGDIQEEGQYTRDRESLEVTDSEEENDAPAIPPRPITSHSTAYKGQDIIDSRLIPQKFHKLLNINPGEEDQVERKPIPPPRPSRRLTPPLPPRAGTLDNTQRPTVYNKRPSKSLPNFTKSAEFEIDITSILIVKDSLWVGRSCGDICIVNIDRDKPVGYSKVVADMYDLNCKFRAGKTIQGVQLVKTGDSIAAAYKLSDGTESEVQIAFWDSYGVQDVRRVDKYWGNILAIEKDLLPDNADNSF